jgi:hypothetical protein
MADSATTPAVKNTVELDADVNVEFNEATSRQQINSGESVKTLFGKLRKFLADLKAVAFSGSYNDLSDAPESLPANGGNADTAKQINCDTIIGTDESCTYHTILDWANHYEYQGCSAWAFVLINDIPDDAPEREDGVVRIESDETGERRLVTWITYNKTLTHIYHRSIYNSSWNTDWSTIDTDTVDGLHASDLVRAFNGTEMDNNRILIPNDVHVGNWLVANAEVGMQYYINPDSAGLSGLPDGNVSWAWFIFNGVEYFAKTIEDRLFYMNYINSYNGWSEIYTSKSKPYVTGRISASYSTEVQNFNCLDFTPSVVICHHAEEYSTGGTIKWAAPITNGFSLTINDTTATYVDYIAFK